MKRAHGDRWWERRESEVAHAKQALREERDGWAGWMLALNPATFAGYTFADADTSQSRARWALRRWFVDVPEKLGRPVYGIVCTEYQKRGAIHFHAALRGLMPAERVSVGEVLAVRGLAQRVWAELTGSRARFDPWSEPRARYIAKYVTKGGLLEPLGAWPQDRPAGEWTQPRLPFYGRQVATA